MRLVLALAAALALSGCGADDPAAHTTPGASALGAPTPDGGLSVADAKASDLSGPLMVRGYVIADVDEYRLCEAILESEPPQCGEPSLRINGLSPEELRRLFDRREQVSLLGEIDGDVIVVSETAQG